MKAPRALLAIAICGAVFAMSACTAAPEPAEPTPLFATEEEAFAAAEATYRAYVDALNEVDLSDPATFEPVFALTTGTANSELRQTFSQMHADGWIVEGESVPSLIDWIDDGSWESHSSLAVCLDVSDVAVADPTGTSVVQEDRGSVQSMRIDLVPSTTGAFNWSIAKISGREGAPLCD